MTNSYFECHVTLADPGNHGIGDLRRLIEKSGWRFSCIDGDIVEGAGIKCYATRHWNTGLGVQAVLNNLLSYAQYLELSGYTVTRRKVEHVIYDDRSSKVCPDSCIECLKPQE